MAQASCTEMTLMYCNLKMDYIMGHIFCTEIEILNPGSHDISQKLRQTKCIIFKIWRLKCTIIPKKAILHLAIWRNWCLIIQKLKIKHIVCLSFWDISRDPGFRIFILTHKFWALRTVFVAYFSCLSLSLSLSHSAFAMFIL